jgi:hypothetical protein
VACLLGWCRHMGGGVRMTIQHASWRLWLAYSQVILAMSVALSGCVPPDGVRPAPREDARATGAEGAGAPAEAPPRIIFFTANPPSVIPGGSSTLEWRTDSAVRVEISGLGPVPITGSRTIVPDRPAYVLTATNRRGERITEEIRIGGTDRPIMGEVTLPPQIIQFEAQPPSVMAGDSVTLRWRTAFADTVEISGLGRVPEAGSRTVRPSGAQRYTLVASNPKGQTVREEVQVFVAYPQVIGPKPEIGRPPPGLIKAVPQVQPRPPRTVRPVPLAQPAPPRQVTRVAPMRRAALSAPRQQLPTSGSEFSHFPRKTTLRWAPEQGAARYAVEVQYCQRAGCATTAKRYKTDSNLTGTEYTFDFIGAQPGRWRVWAVDRHGKPGAKSPWWSFRFTR